MAYQNILVETNDRISVLTINRPDKRNALNHATRDEMREALNSLERSPESRVLVITGAGDNAGSEVNWYRGADLISSTNPTPSQTFNAFDDVLNGVFVG